MENTIQYLRNLENEKTGSVPPMIPYKTGQPWNLEFPAVSEKFVESVKRLSISPEKAIEIYSKYPIQEVCPVGDIFTFIRHDGLVSLCACLSDRRLVLGNYLDLTQEEMSAARRGHPVCHECLKYRMNLYYNVVCGEKFNL